MDLLGADSDHENICWAIEKKKVVYPILLVHSKYTDITVPEALSERVLTVNENRDLFDMLEWCLQERRVFVFDNASYESSHYREILLDWFEEINEVHDKLANRYKNRGLVILRELYKLLPSIGATKTTGQGALLKETVKTMFRERRHGKLFFIGDIQRDIELDKGVRTLMTTKFIRRSPEEALESDIKQINYNIRRYYELCERRGSYMPAVMTKCPLIDRLARTQMYVWKQGGEVVFKTGIPMPGFGYFDSFETSLEEVCGIKYETDGDMLREYMNTRFNVLDYDTWITRLRSGVVEAGVPLTGEHIMRQLRWDLGVDKFNTFLAKMLRLGVIATYKKPRHIDTPLPTMFFLVPQDLGENMQHHPIHFDFDEGDYGLSSPRVDEILAIPARRPRKSPVKIPFTKRYRSDSWVVRMLATPRLPRFTMRQIGAVFNITHTAVLKGMQMLQKEGLLTKKRFISEKGKQLLAEAYPDAKPVPTEGSGETSVSNGE